MIRSGQKVGAKKVAGGQKQVAGGFFSSWFGRKPKKEEQELEESKEEGKFNQSEKRHGFNHKLECHTVRYSA